MRYVSRLNYAIRAPHVVRHLAFLFALKLAATWRGVNPAKREPVMTALQQLPLASQLDILSEESSARPEVFPRIIFQTWKIRSPLPHNYAFWSQTFAVHHPDHKHVIWDDLDNRAFIELHFPWFLPTYDAYPREILRADAVRYFFLYLFGGLYVDMDTECLGPVSFDTRIGQVWLGQMGQDTSSKHSIPNAIMASTPRQSFWLFVVSLMEERAAEFRKARSGDPIGVEYFTGPILLRDAYLSYLRDPQGSLAKVKNIAERLSGELRPATPRSQIVLLPASDWFPLDWRNPIHKAIRRELMRRELVVPPGLSRRLFPRSRLLTYWTHSW